MPEGTCQGRTKPATKMKPPGRRRFGGRLFGVKRFDHMAPLKAVFAER